MQECMPSTIQVICLYLNVLSINQSTAPFLTAPFVNNWLHENVLLYTYARSTSTTVGIISHIFFVTTDNLLLEIYI